jgi:hypothetical protein
MEVVAAKNTKIPVEKRLFRRRDRLQFQRASI